MRGIGLAIGCSVLFGVGYCFGSDIERRPVRYSQSVGENPITQLKQKLENGEVKLQYKPHVGYLPSLLEALDISVNSQTLVFSKTSLQRNRIAPKTPRAIYFNDDVYIGFCRGGEVLEVSVSDPKLGTEFYLLTQDRESPKLIRQTEDCLICHGSSATQGMPGHLIRSVYTDRAGIPLLSMGSHRIDQTAPFEKRFGGWYVTGKHEGKPHLGNLILGKEQVVEEVKNEKGLDRDSLEDMFDTSIYPTPKADIVAQMVLIHQAHVHNMITKLSLETQFALYEERELNRELKEPLDKRWDSTQRRIRNQAADLVRSLLFSEEAQIPALEGGTPFATEFAQTGLKDSQGRSLRKIRAAGRLMEYPCSYLIYTKAITELPEEAMRELVQQLKAALSDDDTNPDFKHLSLDDKRAIREILAETWTPFQQVNPNATR